MKEPYIPINNILTLANLLRAARLAQGLTRDELADGTGLSPKFITHVEGGKPTAQIGKVLALLSELGVNLYAETSTVISPELTAKAQRRRRTTRHDD